MPYGEFPAGIKRLLARLPYSCSEPEYTHFRQDIVRKWIRDVADAHENGLQQVRDAALAQLADPDPAMLQRAITCLFVVGRSSDVPAVEPLTSHPDESVRKAAHTCLFEIRRRTD